MRRNHLTVIRAENETGKTSMLTALQWALYGDDALPGKGIDYRIHPLDWDEGSGARVPIDVMIEFEVTTSQPTGRGHPRTSSTRYRLVRSTIEEVRGTEWIRGPSTPKLYQLTNTGDVPIHQPEATIVDELPPDLREVFFTDGDRALNFIEASLSTSTKRDRVQKAIRSLLGLAVLESAQKHVKDAALDVNRRAQRGAKNESLAELSRRIDATSKEIEEFEQKVKGAADQFEEFDVKLADIDKQIDAVLARGDQEKLSRELEATRNNLKRHDEGLEKLDKAHAGLFSQFKPLREIYLPNTPEGDKVYSTPGAQGKIPNTTITVLEDVSKNQSIASAENR